MPIFVLIAHFAIGKWAREKIINGVTLTIAFAADTFFLVRVCVGVCVRVWRWFFACV